jgi:hypothetical protein
MAQGKLLTRMVNRESRSSNRLRREIRLPRRSYAHASALLDALAVSVEDVNDLSERDEKWRGALADLRGLGLSDDGIKALARCDDRREFWGAHLSNLPEPWCGLATLRPLSTTSVTRLLEALDPRPTRSAIDKARPFLLDALGQGNTRGRRPAGAPAAGGVTEADLEYEMLRLVRAATDLSAAPADQYWAHRKALLDKADLWLQRLADLNVPR